MSFAAGPKGGVTLGRLGASVGEASAFPSGHDPGGLGSSPASSGSLLSDGSASPSLSAAPSACALSLSLCVSVNKQINKY